MQRWEGVGCEGRACGGGLHGVTVAVDWDH